jgi:putative transposase
MDIFALLQPIEDSLSKATLRQMSRVILAMLAMTGRVTMLGLSRWAEAGGSYRSIQRFYNTAIPWAQVYWQFFSQHLLRKEEVYILAGDESVVSKAGKKTYGLDHFFSGLQQRVIPSLSFFVVSLVSVKNGVHIQCAWSKRYAAKKKKQRAKPRKRRKMSNSPSRNANGDAPKAARTKINQKLSSLQSCYGYKRC